MFKQILVPTDFSNASRTALEYAIDLATRYGASIHLLHVVDEPAYVTTYPDGYFAGLPELRQQLVDDANRQLALTAQICEVANVPFNTQLATGRPAPTVVQHAADSDADVIVMGTHGRGGLEHFILGSVAERVVRTAPCPVLTVRAAAEDRDKP
jgi:nucleotide-binding universal stress UspA family protein